MSRILIYCIACGLWAALSLAVVQPLAGDDDAAEPAGSSLAQENDPDGVSGQQPADDVAPSGDNTEPPAGDGKPSADVAGAPESTEPAKSARRPAKPAVTPARTRLKAFDNIGPIEDDSESSETASKGDEPSHADPQTADEAGHTPQETKTEAQHAIRLDPVALRDVTPGVSTVAQLDAKWGAASIDQTRLGSGKRAYEFQPFTSVEVALVEGKVASIEASFADPAALDELAREFLGLAEGEETHGSVTIRDSAGAPLGVAYPERGVVFGFDARVGQAAPAAAAVSEQRVAKVLFDPIDTELFYLRAEQHHRQSPRQSLRDLEYVLEKDPRHLSASLLTARVYLEAGQLTEAAGAIDAAVKIDPNHAGALLTKAEILADSGDFTAGIENCERVLRLRQIAPEMKAKAQCLLGDCLAGGPKRDYARAIEYHLAAIKTAQPFADSTVAVQRRIAKHVLVSAQLGVANDIAWGHWQQKERAVPKWLAQAHATAEDLIDREGGDEIVHLLVLRKALAASAGMQGKLDPVAWTKEAIKSGRRLIDAADDPWRRARLEWELGLALYDALQADQSRGYHDHALSNSSLVAKYLQSALKEREETPHGAYLLGRLYFRVGAIHAVELSDHQSAAGWFAKALPLLERPLPATAAADVGRLGESFVSIGITYWETGRRAEAMRITKHGISLISQGIKERVIEQDALSVPYSNLAFMHRELGQAKEAENYAAMASRASAAKRR